MTTGRDVLTYALKKAGITGQGRTASATDITDALADLNDMVGQWNTNRWMVWNLVDISITATGALFYTVGPGGDFDVNPRPNRLEAAFQRQPVVGGLPIDTPLEIIPSQEEYSRLSLKSLQSFGLYVFLDTSYPLAILRPYPVPNANLYEIHLIMKNVVPTITVDTDMAALPLMYIPAMKFNLARRLRQAYGKGKTPDAELNSLAESSLQTIKDANLQIPELVMPKVLRVQSSGYNIFNDQFGNG